MISAVFAPPPGVLAALVSIGPVTAFELGPLVLLGVLYAGRTRALSRAGGRLAGRRAASFYAGLLVLAAAILLLAIPSRKMFVAQSIDELLIGDVAPLLLVLGLSAPLLAPLKRIAVLGWVRWLWNPLVAFGLWTLDLYAWHVPRLFRAALEHPYLHALQDLSSLVSGIVMWMCLIGPVRHPRWFTDPAKLLYIVSVRLAGAVLGNLLLWSGTVAYGLYLEQDALREISPLADQNLGGAIILIEQSIALLALFAWLYVRSKEPSGIHRGKRLEMEFQPVDGVHATPPREEPRPR